MRFVFWTLNWLWLTFHSKNLKPITHSIMSMHRTCASCIYSERNLFLIFTKFVHRKFIVPTESFAKVLFSMKCSCQRKFNLRPKNMLYNFFLHLLVSFGNFLNEFNNIYYKKGEITKFYRLRPFAVNRPCVFVILIQWCLAVSQSGSRNFVCYWSRRPSFRKVGFAVVRSLLLRNDSFLHGIGKYRREYSLHQGEGK